MLEAEAPDDQFGYSVASAGDVNADGYSDVAVGALRNDAGGDAAGRVYLYLGGRSPDTTPDLVMTGPVAGAQFGIAVASAGDLNDDGHDDMICGAVPITAGLGRAYIFLGGQSLDNVPDLELSGEAPNDGFGISVGTAGDANGDGYTDLIVGASGSSAAGTSSGRAYVFYGGNPMDPVPDRTLTGESASDGFGTSACTLGDINADHKDEVGVGALWAGPGGSIGVGTFSIFYGGSASSSPNIVISVGALGDEFGVAAAGGGDINADGRPDLVVGAQGNDVAGNFAGRAYALTPIPLNLVAPDGGETWLAGRFERIKWTGAGAADLYLSLDGGFTWTAVALAVGGDVVNAYDLTAPSTPTAFAKVAVTPSGVPPIHAAADRTNGVFSIVLPTGVEEVPSATSGFELSSPTPNPLVSGGSSRFDLTLPKAETVDFALFDMRGRLVASRSAHHYASAGTFEITWRPGPLPSGTYYAKVTSASGRSAGATWVLVR